MLERARDQGRREYYESELACPPFPIALDYLWTAFRRLARRRSSNGFGYNPISWGDIDAFVRHSKIVLAPWEIEIIEELDDIERSEMSKAMNAQSEQSKN